ncbi:unnamed protein product [Clonostachys rhizophaga]|uniref:Uncharacterized protein n=1 Tax=Clonostachys rhizophaga TaxID=160324 RepID=A0A9N9VT56_9HYPO|nr:unnamed protein product [Clonostachys rhizophaga]
MTFYFDDAPSIAEQKSLEKITWPCPNRQEHSERSRKPRQNNICTIRSLERFVLGRLVARRVNLLLAQHYAADPETRRQSEHEPFASTLRFDEGDCGPAAYVTARIEIEIAKLLARRLQETYQDSI